MLAPEECSRQIVKDSDSDTLDSTRKEDEGVGNKCGLGGTTNNSSSGNVSEFVDKPDDAGNVQHPIGDSQSIEGKSCI